MITTSDSFYTYDLGKYFTILPAVPNFNLNEFVTKFNGSGNGYIVKQVHVVANTNPSKNHTLSFSGEIPEQKQ